MFENKFTEFLEINAIFSREGGDIQDINPDLLKYLFLRSYLQRYIFMTRILTIPIKIYVDFW